MKNIDYIKSLSLEEFAKILIVTECEGYCYQRYISADGSAYYEYEDALEQTIIWLNQEYEEEN
jgi:hypothetical protein